MDAKVPTVPVTITTSALTELAWILGGFVVNDGVEEAGIDLAEAAAPATAGATATAGAGAGAGVPRPGRRSSSSSGGGSSSTGGGGGGGGDGGSRRRASLGGRAGAGPSSPSPLMPVKVIYRRPSKVWRSRGGSSVLDAAVEKQCSLVYCCWNKRRLSNLMPTRSDAGQGRQGRPSKVQQIVQVKSVCKSWDLAFEHKCVRVFLMPVDQYHNLHLAGSPMHQWASICFRS